MGYQHLNLMHRHNPSSNFTFNMQSSPSSNYCSFWPNTIVARGVHGSVWSNYERNHQLTRQGRFANFQPIVKPLVIKSSGLVDFFWQIWISGLDGSYHVLHNFYNDCQITKMCAFIISTRIVCWFLSKNV